jgi:hypothetical protein
MKYKIIKEKILDDYFDIAFGYKTQINNLNPILFSFVN